MTKIRCRACGRRYDYQEHNLCPGCGAYNKPAGSAAADYREAFQEDAAAESGRGKPSGKRGARWGLCAALIAVLVVLLNIGVRFVVRFDSIDVAEPELAAAPSEIHYTIHSDVGQQFAVDGQPVTVKYVTVEEDCLLVWVEWDNHARRMPELNLKTDTLSAVADPHSEELLDEGLALYTYPLEDMGGIDWQGTIEAYLRFSDWENDGQEVWVTLTEALRKAAETDQ